MLSKTLWLLPLFSFIYAILLSQIPTFLLSVVKPLMKENLILNQTSVLNVGQVHIVNLLQLLD